MNDQLVIAIVDGRGDLPPLDELAERLTVALDRPVSLDLRVIQALKSNSGGS